MSEIYTLKQIQVDAARYRWIRENLEDFVWHFNEVIGEGRDYPAECDCTVDAELAGDE